MANASPFSHEPYRLQVVETVDSDSLRMLYESVGWTSYAQDLSALQAAISGSDYVVTASLDDVLVGLVRAVSDDSSITYLQDVLVHPEHQRQGLGKRLVDMVLARYRHVRQKVLITDGRPEQLKFYTSLGFTNTRFLVDTPLNAFVMIGDRELR